MKRPTAKNVRGWVLRKFRTLACAQAAVPFSANPGCRSVDFSSHRCPSILRNHAIVGSYQLAIRYQKATSLVANRNQSDICQVSVGCLVATRQPLAIG